MVVTKSEPNRLARDAFLDSALADPQKNSIHFFDLDLTRADVARLAEGLAGFMQKKGLVKGDRLILCGQNDPTFVLTLLAAWHLGVAVVPVNPMYKSHEWEYILEDSGAKAIIAIDDVYENVLAELLTQAGPQHSFVLKYTQDDDECLRDPLNYVVSEAKTVREAIFEGAAVDVWPAELTPADVATISYTSGTTGRPKGAMNTHGNISANAANIAAWLKIDGTDSILAVAPLFHITGLVMHAVLALSAGVPLVLTHRFMPDEVVVAIKKHRPTFTIGSITAFILLGQSETVTAEDLSSLTKLYSGGAPIPPAVAEDLRTRLGLHIHNGYGLTESSSATHLVPLGEDPRVDAESGSMSIGVPVFGTTARIVDEAGNSLPAGEVGELAIRGPQVTPGYWQKPEATAEALPDGELRTGDVAFCDENGWYYIVDRKKDMINASGYKVWPREVEDAIYLHPAVREVAVVGIADAYRGESVKAVISFKSGQTATAEDIAAHCRNVLAAYKCPREIEFMADLPKTASGKILRRELRD